MRPPETAAGLDEGAVRDVLDHLADTSGVTGANLFRLLVVKVPITSSHIPTREHVTRDTIMDYVP